MATEAYKITQDTSLPKAINLLYEDEIQGKVYATEGRTYNAGDYVLAEDVAPNVRDAIDDGQYDAVLESASRSDYDEWLTSLEQSLVRVPEHAVEHLALVQDGKRVVDRETAIELRGLGAEDAGKAQEAAKADGADERPNLTFEGTPDPGSSDDATVGGRVKDADDSYVDAQEAAEAEVQVTPSGVVATNPFVAAAEETESAQKAARPRRSSKKQDTESSSGSSE